MQTHWGFIYFTHMAKSQPYYFPHYIGARNDNKILKLRRVLGLEGYAIYFMLLEVLREQNDFKYPIHGISELEFEFRVSKEKISTVVFDYELFTVDKQKRFFSPKLIEYLQPYLDKVERAKAAINKRWAMTRNTNEDTNVSTNEGTKEILLSNISNKVSNISKEKKGNKNKDFTPPSLIEVQEYFKSKDYPVELADKAYMFYSELNWHDTNNKPVKNWKTKMINVWFKPENKLPPKYQMTERDQW